jgi:osmoprotectant transport system permease protein
VGQRPLPGVRGRGGKPPARVARIIPAFLAVGLAASAASAEAPATIRVGSKAFTESVILGEAMARLVRSAGVAAGHRSGLGGTQVLMAALLSGEIDAYPEYTGTIAEEVLSAERAAGRPVPADDEDALRAALAKRGVLMGRRLGFEDSYALGVREDVADRLNLRNISDLARHPELRIGVSDEFLNRPDGWPGLKARYGLPQTVRGMDHALAYRGLEAGSLDVADLYTTDAEIRRLGLRVLADDRRHFPRYEAVILMRADLPQRSPAAWAALCRLEGRIDTAAMTRLNARTLIDRVPEARVAADFLAETLALPAAGDGSTDGAAEPDADAASASRLGWSDRLARLWGDTRDHLLMVAVSLAASVAVAVPLGVVAFRYPAAGRVILGAAGVVQTLPSLALLVFLIPFLGLGAKPAVAALFLYGLLPIIRNTHAGLTEIPSGLRESAEALGLSTAARLRMIELPLASRSILAGIKTAAVINVGTATIGAVIGAGGYGQPILAGIRLNDTGLLLQGAVPAALMAVGMQSLFGWAELLFVPAGLRAKAAR